MHSQFSWDAPQGSMREQCRRAVQIGLQAIAFTEHLDSVPESGGSGQFRAEAYFAELARCREEFRDLTIQSGLEVGEPHRSAPQVTATLAQGSFDRVVGSLHCARDLDGSWRDFSSRGFLRADVAEAQMDAYFRELHAMVASSTGYEVLGHLDVAKRYWPAAVPDYQTTRHEPLIREVLQEAAGRDLVLEINTSGLRLPAKALCPDLTVLRWWREAGGRAVALGSDAHEPAMVGADLRVASEAAESAGFCPPRHPLDHWPVSRPG